MVYGVEKEIKFADGASATPALAIWRPLREALCAHPFAGACRGNPGGAGVRVFHPGEV